MPDQLEDSPLLDGSSHVVGMDRSYGPVLIPAKRPFYLQNAHGDVSGVRKKRPGVAFNDILENLGSAISGVRVQQWANIVWSAYTNGATHKMWKDDASFSTTFSSAAQALVAANTTMFRLSASENAYSWASSDASPTDEGNTNTKFPRSINAIWTTQRRMLAISNLTAAPYAQDLVWYSDANDPKTWDRTNNAIRVTGGKEPQIMNIFEWKENLILVGKADSIYVLDISNPSPSLWQSREIVRGLGFGSMHPQSIVRVGDDVFFIGRDGVYSLNAVMASGTGVPKPITYEINDFMTVTTTGGIGSASGYLDRQSVRDKAYLVYQDGKLFLFSENFSFGFMYVVDERRWSYYTITTPTNWNSPYAANVFNPTSGNDNGHIIGVIHHANAVWSPGDVVLAFVDGLSSGVDATQDYQGHGTVRNVVYQEDTGPFHYDLLANPKQGVFFEVMGIADAGSSLAISYMIDESQTWVSLGTMDFTKDKDGNAATAGQLITKKYSLNGLAPFREIRFRMSDSTAYQTQIVAYFVAAHPNNMELS